MVTKERVIEELETVYDPELGLDVYTLGLIYSINIISDTEVNILMTYTTPACPYGPVLNNSITDALRGLGFNRTLIKLTFVPAWKPPANIREMLGL